ncbi:acetylcholinesterase-like [Ptychodera flava]|uniref:acetylcholinesterase-like n=1 Tax=Ptychodera flava TaxID=63121 RepID=UPI00396A31E7
MGYPAGVIIALGLYICDFCVDSHDGAIARLGDNGSLLGRRLDVVGAKVDAFLGVRYADPPVGDRRFQMAVPTEASWTGLRNATEFGSACWQTVYPNLENFTGHVWWTTSDPMSEDCLFLNVWTPFPRPINAPVFVFIHGGSFKSGTTSTLLYRGDTLATAENCVVVSMNYRLGPFGFSAFYTNKEPGNLGLMDQTLALKWVKKNIQYFGGDPKRVTLIGHSAGAASVGFHLLSPMSRSLFHRAILQSGAPNAPWAITYKSKALEDVGKMAKELQCPTWCGAEHVEHEAIVQETLSCLRQRKAEEFVTRGSSEYGLNAVVIDGNFLSHNPISLLVNTSLQKDQIPVLANRSLQRDQIPVLLGMVDEEATLNLPFFEFTMFADMAAVHETYNELYQQHINMLYPSAAESVTDAIGFQYRNWLDPENGTLLHRSIIELWEDYCMFCPVREFAKYYAMTGNDVYAYIFENTPTNSPYPEWMGMVHTDELFFTLGRALHDEENMTEAEKTFSRVVMKYWTNFGRSGNPNEPRLSNTNLQQWPKHTAENPSYLPLSTSVVQQKTIVRQIGRERQCAFWSHLVPELENDEKIPPGYHPIFLSDIYSELGASRSSGVVCSGQVTVSASTLNILIALAIFAVHVSYFGYVSGILMCG